MQNKTIGSNPVTDNVVNQVTEVSRETLPTLEQFKEWMDNVYFQSYVRCGMHQSVVKRNISIVADAVNTFISSWEWSQQLKGNKE